MSGSDQGDNKSLTIPTVVEIPAEFSLKQRRRDAPGCETWDVFDRTHKKKVVLKRLKKICCGNDAALERFRTDLATLESARRQNAAWPGVLMLGHDDEGVWYLRETVPGRGLDDMVSPAKSLREFDAGRRFATLTEWLIRLHETGLVHRNLKPGNIFSAGKDDAIFADPDVGHFRDPAVFGESYDPSLFGPTDFLAPEQRKAGATEAADVRTDLWSLAACYAFALTGSLPDQLDPQQLPEASRDLILSALDTDPARRPATASEFLDGLERVVRATRPSAFESSIFIPPQDAPIPPAASEVPPSPTTEETAPAPLPRDESLPPGTECPQCHAPVRSASDRICSQCGRVFLEPCLNCQSTNPFWTPLCRGCGSDLPALKQKMLATLQAQKQQVLKLRESYGHDKTLPLLKYMSTVNHPDFAAFKEWAKSMTALIQKERRDIRSYVENVRTQANAAMTEQKYDRVRQILEQVPRPLLDDPMRKQYVEAGDALTEVDSLIREIRNAIATKQYSPLLSCVQRYLELKANDPEARNLQQKIEKLTTVASAKGMKLRRIPSGRFYMGSHESDEYLRNNERPQHRVQITRNLFFGVYPVTQREFLELMEFNPSVANDDENGPADSITWFSAVEFCNRMSEQENLSPFYELKKVKRRSNGTIESADVDTLGGDGYRLPSEAEWEYACRAGSITPWCFGDQVMDVGDYAWYFDNATMETHPVGEKKPNAWGLFDMHGNVMEWCHDWYGEFYYQQCPDEQENPTGPESGVAKVLRGGAWQFGAEATRCAYRNSSGPETASSVIGFRVCRNAVDEVM